MGPREGLGAADRPPHLADSETYPFTIETKPLDWELLHIELDKPEMALGSRYASNFDNEDRQSIVH